MPSLRTPGKAALVLVPGALAALLAAKYVEDRRVAGIWQTLEDAPAETDVFTPERVADLPGPARRYFLHAIRPGTPLASRLYWRYRGAMRPNVGAAPMALTAEQLIVNGRGFVWKAIAQRGPLVMNVADHYLDGEARMRVNAYGLVPVVNASGPDIAKSARGRLLVEYVAIPSALLPGPHVQIEAMDENHFRALVDLHGETTPITIHAGPDGRMLEVTMPRWGNIMTGGSYQYIPYGAAAGVERTYGGYTIPSQLTAAWWYGTDRYLEQIRLELAEARLT